MFVSSVDKPSMDAAKDVCLGSKNSKNTLISCMVVGFDLCHCFAVCLNWRNFVECQPNVKFCLGYYVASVASAWSFNTIFRTFSSWLPWKKYDFTAARQNYTFSLFSEKAPYESYKNVGFLSNILIHSPANHVIPQTKIYKYCQS